MPAAPTAAQDRARSASVGGPSARWMRASKSRTQARTKAFGAQTRHARNTA